jgi:hypothetical protein
MGCIDLSSVAALARDGQGFVKGARGAVRVLPLGMTLLAGHPFVGPGEAELRIVVVIEPRRGPEGVHIVTGGTAAFPELAPMRILMAILAGAPVLGEGQGGNRFSGSDEGGSGGGVL